MPTPHVECHSLSALGDVPNNPRCPLLIYRHVLAGAGDRASAFERLFGTHGWGNGWRDGIYDHHHFHTMAHEVLGIAAGTAAVRFGGELGVTVEVQAGDMVVIPAGVAHRNLGASDDFLVVGAYPVGTEPDMNRPGDGDLIAQQARIAAVPLPTTDPAYGRDGPLLRAWGEGAEG